MRSKKFSIDYIRMFSEMYIERDTQIKNNMGILDSFKTKVGVHQGSTLSPFFVALFDKALK